MNEWKHKKEMQTVSATAASEDWEKTWIRDIKLSPCGIQQSQIGQVDIP